MTDLPPNGLPAPSAVPLPAVSSTQLQSARDAWIGAGLRGEDFDQGLAGPLPATKVAPPVSEAPQGPQGGIPRPQALAMAQALLANGVDPVRVQAALQAEGVDAPMEEITKPNAQTQIEAAFGAAKPEQISVDWRSLGYGNADMGTLAELNGEATRWAAEVGFPAPLAGGVIERAIQASQTVAGLSDAGKALWMRSEEAAFARSVGPENVEVEMRNAAYALRRAGPSFTAKLHKSGALSEHGVILQLARQGARLASMSN